MADRKGKRTFDQWLKKQMRNPRFRKAWEEAQRESELTRRLVRLRVEQGLTQAQVAQMVGTKQEAISRLEHRPPSHPTKLLQKVAAVYGCDVRSCIELVHR